MKFLIWLLVALLPFHAILVTTLKCNFIVNMDMLRFWKEGVVWLLFIVTVFWVLNRHRWNFAKIYKNNYILWTATTFVLCSMAYIYFPFLQGAIVDEFPYLWFKPSALLGFKYDTFFIFCLVIWLYLSVFKENYNKFLLILFWSAWFAISIFTPWYLFGDISSVTNIFGFSGEVSTYKVNECISFSQNVEWQHRFQWSFAGPIRWSVFLTIVYFLYIWYFFNYLQTSKNVILTFQEKWSEKGFISFTNRITDISKALIVIPSLLVVTGIFYSYSKTSVLWLLFGISLFVYFVYTVVYNKKVTKNMILTLWWLSLLPIIAIAVIKRDLFLHLGSVINRFDNLVTSFHMFTYNPAWAWLWIAWPASSLGNSIESAWDLSVALASIGTTHKFLPENWYVQILLEQWMWWVWFFIWFLSCIWVTLYTIMQKKKDFFSIGIFVSFCALLFMANFTHAFEESATSYTLFLFIGWYIGNNIWMFYKK